MFSQPSAPLGTRIIPVSVSRTLSSLGLELQVRKIITNPTIATTALMPCVLGIGIADSLVYAMQEHGISEEEALSNFVLFDAHGECMVFIYSFTIRSL